MRLVLLFWVLLFAAPAQADWFRDFNNGTLQGLTVADFANAFTTSVVNGNLRFQSKGTGGNKDAIIAYDTQSFTQISAKLLIRYSTNPNLGPPGTKMNGGILVRGNLATVSGYILVMNDSGFLQMYKVTGGVPDEQNHFNGCPTWSVQDLPNFDHTRDWWLRFEAVTEGSTVRVRGRAWPEGESEHCTWDVECVDAVSPYLSGIVAIESDEDENGYFLDLDNASASSTLSCREICDNNIDDNQDGLVDCRDPQCAAVAVCQCRTPFADADGDGDVDMDDLGVVQRCYTGEGGLAAVAACGCFDRDDVNENGIYERAVDGDGDVDAGDLLRFKACLSRARVAADHGCGQ